MSDYSFLSLPDDFDLWQTLNCGQCFRFSKGDDGIIRGVALDRYLEFTIDGAELCVNCDDEFAKGELSDFLGLNDDYAIVKSELSSDPTLQKAMEYAGGIRILRQPAWETLCSFIISQNNNIKRIGGIIARLCSCFGAEITPGQFSFPKASVLSSLSEADLYPLRCGFRAKYILDAAKKVDCGQVDFGIVDKADTENARKMLMSICGVGPKVADCTLLFGFHKLDAFPKDVWIKKALEIYYPQGFPKSAEKYGGIAQQYLFHYIRTCENSNKD